MLRVRIKLPRGCEITYTNVDVVKDATVAMLEAAGADAGMLIGEAGRPWGAAPVCRHYTPPLDTNGAAIRRASEVIVSTPDPILAGFLAKADPAAMVKRQPATGESVNMAGARMVPDLDPIVEGGQDFIEALCLTPILASRQGDRAAGRWHSDVRDVDLSATISQRLSRLAGRNVELTLEPDALYLSGRRSHAMRMDIKTRGAKRVVLVGMMFPFTLSGPPEDLRLAWYAGIGERNRLGFGFFGAIS